MSSVRHRQAPSGLRDMGPTSRVRTSPASVRCRDCGKFSLDCDELGRCGKCRGETKAEERHRIRQEKAAARRAASPLTGETWAERTLAAMERQEAARARRRIYGRRTA